MATPSFKEKHFLLRDAHRYCQHPTATGVCGQRFAKATSVSGLKKHYTLCHKVTAQLLGLFAQQESGREVAAAASPDAAASHSESDSVVDMIDAQSPSAAVASKPRARVASAASSIASPPPAKAARTSQVTLHSAFMVSGNTNLVAAVALFFATTISPTTLLIPRAGMLWWEQFVLATLQLRIVAR
jgi:hypothetical protein